MDALTNIKWMTKITPSPSVDKKTHVLVSINRHLRDDGQKRLNLTIPEAIIDAAGLEIGKSYAVAISGKNILLKRDEFGFILARVGAGVGTFGGKISMGIGADQVLHIIDEDSHYKQYVPAESVQTTTDKKVAVIHL